MVPLLRVVSPAAERWDELIGRNGRLLGWNGISHVCLSSGRFYMECKPHLTGEMVMVKRLILTAGAFAALLSIAACGASEPEGSSPRAADESQSPIKSGSSDQPCPYVEAKPTYLPWVDNNEEVPQPRRDIEGETSYVTWASDDDASGHTFVVFRRNSEPLGGKGEPVSVTVEGAPGYFYAAPGPQAAIVWKTNSQKCDLITLELSLPDATQDKLRQELMRVAESLEE